jgi:uncharacterized protein (TIGR03000 family)
MRGQTRRFMVAGTVAFLIGLAGVTEARAQRRVVVHSGGGMTHSGGGEFHGTTGMGRTFTTTPLFFGRGPIFEPNIFIPGGGSFVPNANNNSGSYPSYYTPFSSIAPQYNAAPGYAAPSYAYVRPSTATATAANTETPNTVTTASYGTDELRGELPADARLFFNGVETTGQIGGRVRHYVTPRLEPGETYKFVLRAEWMQDGRMVERSREVKVEAGDLINVDFVPQAS